MALLLIMLSLGALSSGFYFWFLRWHGKRTRDTVTSHTALQNEWNVYRRGEKIAVLRTNTAPRTVPGVLFAFFFHWWAPIGLWRYGWVNTLKFLLIPVVVASLAAFAINLVIELGDGSIFFGALFLFATPLRGAVGIYLSRNDALLRAETLVRRGWLRVGTCSADSSKVARAKWRAGTNDLSATPTNANTEISGGSAADRGR